MAWQNGPIQKRSVNQEGRTRERRQYASRDRTPNANSAAIAEHTKRDHGASGGWSEIAQQERKRVSDDITAPRIMNHGRDVIRIRCGRGDKTCDDNPADEMGRCDELAHLR